MFPGASMSGSLREGHSRVRGSPNSAPHRPVSDEAIARLSRVFRIDKIPDTLSRYRTPPEYMTDLYETLAYQNGITKQDTPFKADIVRGLPDRGGWGLCSGMREGGRVWLKCDLK